MPLALTPDQLKTIMPAASDDNIAKYLPALNQELERYQVDTPLRQAHFIAQIGHESGSLNYSLENLNYSASALQAVFGKYFTTPEMAEEYARKPEAIANVVYANRMGNGDTDSGEGWQFRGRGLIQLTGKSNYQALNQFLLQSTGVDPGLTDDPNPVSEDPNISVAAACWYWQERNINTLADQDDVEGVTRKINGGTNGLEDRKEFLARCKQVLMNTGDK